MKKCLKFRALIVFFVIFFLNISVVFAAQYKAKLISLNFQDIEVRAVLQIIADFTKLNVIVSDSVQGNITLRLEAVPWDQALDIILSTKGLDKRQVGNVLMIGPIAEMAAREKLDLEHNQKIEELGPLTSELIYLHYANAEELAIMLKEPSNSLMTARGSVSVDKRTNTLLVQDTRKKVQEIRTLIQKLDVAVRQVEISTQIVNADRTLEQTLGVKFHGAKVVQGTRVQYNDRPNDKEGLFSDLSACSTGHIGLGNVGTLGLAFARLPKGLLIDLELQALEYETHSKIIAKPTLLTMDQHKASVEQGIEIPYQEQTPTGATSIAFRKAVLKLEVTPHVTPDMHIALDVHIMNDAPEDIGSSRIRTNRLQTKVLVEDGETVVLGGIMSLNDTQEERKVPILGDIPVIKNAFRSKTKIEGCKELLIFLTPRITHSVPLCTQE
jgi:type IV pilus assembly protein PilQ